MPYSDRLLDYLVGRGQQRLGDGEAKRLGGLEVDDELEPCRSYAGDWVTRSIRRRGEPAFR